MNRWVLVKRAGDGSAQFWAGSRWVGEYPDALLFDRVVPAVFTAQGLSEEGDCEVEVVLKYGTADPVVRVTLPQRMWGSKGPGKAV